MDDPRDKSGEYDDEDQTAKFGVGKNRVDRFCIFERYHFSVRQGEELGEEESTSEIFCGLSGHYLTLSLARPAYRRRTAGFHKTFALHHAYRDHKPFPMYAHFH